MTVAPEIARHELIHRCDKHPDKVQYRTTAEAFDVADRRAPVEGVPIFVYACDHCGYFHLSKKRGTENIGRMLAARQDGAIWESATANPRNAEIIRDERFVDKSPGAEFRADVASAIRKHGSPDELRAADVCEWVGLGLDSWHRKKVRDALAKLGWVSTGATAAQLWHRQLSTVTDVEIAPKVPELAPAPLIVTTPVHTDSPWKIINSADVGEMTIDQLERVYKTAGLRLRVMVRRLED